MTLHEKHPFNSLEPDYILKAIEDNGYICDGRILALNSYENRVYQIGLEDGEPIIAKFYRPKRWTNEQIIEEHEFCIELAEQELPVVPPIRINGNTLHQYDDFRLAIYSRKGGYAPEFDNLDNLLILGRFIGRIHAVSKLHPFTFRPSISCKQYGHESVSFLRGKFIPDYLQASYDAIVNELLEMIGEIFVDADNSDFIRVHGDCHVGNILWRDDAPHFIDFDDARMGPAIQDIWMLLSGDRARQTAQLNEICEGYSEFAIFPMHQLKLIEALRTLRMFYFSAWLAKRWDDPAFPHSFPWFNTVQYWEQHIADLREQIIELQKPTLNLFG